MRVFVDTETTGLDPRHHSILSVCIGNREIGYHTFRFKPDPDKIIDPGAMAINNIDLNTPFKDQREEFIQFLIELVKIHNFLDPVGHNYQFDIGFIEQILGKKGYSNFFSRRYIDTMIIAKFIDDTAKECTLNPIIINHPEGYSLGALCMTYGYDNSEAHTAEGDVRATEAIYYALMRYILV